MLSSLYRCPIAHGRSSAVRIIWKLPKEELMHNTQSKRILIFLEQITEMLMNEIMHDNAFAVDLRGENPSYVAMQTHCC